MEPGRIKAVLFLALGVSLCVAARWWESTGAQAAAPLGEQGLEASESELLSIGDCLESYWGEDWAAESVAHRAREDWLAGRVVATPFVLVRSPGRPTGRKQQYKCVYSTGVWCVEHAIYQGECPELDAALEEMEKAKLRRFLAVGEFIDSL